MPVAVPQISKNGARGGNRTRTALTGQGILSLPEAATGTKSRRQVTENSEWRYRIVNERDLGSALLQTQAALAQSKKRRVVPIAEAKEASR